MHGRFLEALQMNYFFVLSVPYVSAVLLSTVYNIQHRFDRVAAFCFHRHTLRAYVALYLLWWVGRNVFSL